MPRTHRSPVPAHVRATIAATVTVFAYGTAVHLGQLITGGGDPYPNTPAWLAGYFVSLTILDPLAGLLLARRRAEGLTLGRLVLLTDAAANAYANYALDHTPGITAGRIGQAVITLLAVTLVAIAPRLRPWLHPTSRH